MIGQVGDGGAQITVPKSRDNISVPCEAPGYQKRTMSLESSASGWGVAQAIGQTNFWTNLLPQTVSMDRAAWLGTAYIIECLRDEVA